MRRMLLLLMMTIGLAVSGAAQSEPLIIELTVASDTSTRPGHRKPAH